MFEYISEQRRGSKLKKIDKRMDKIRAEFNKKYVVLKKQKQSLAKMRAAGRYIAAQNAEMWLTSFAYFIINAMPSAGGGKIKKALLKLMQESHTPEEWFDLEPLYEEMIDDAQTQRVLEGFEDPMDNEQLEELLEALIGEEVDTSPRLTVAKLNEAVKAVSKKNKLTARQLKFNRFAKFMDLFQKKLLSLGVQSDEDIFKYMNDLINVVHRIKISGKAEVQSHGTAKQPVS